MFQDLNLSDEVSAEQLKLSTKDREKLRVWAEKWLAAASTKKPGPWVEKIRPQVWELMEVVTIQTRKGQTYLDCPAKSKPILTLLSRGSPWFDGVDQLELELLGVVMT
jgi:hypothetical protein